MTVGSAVASLCFALDGLSIFASPSTSYNKLTDSNARHHVISIVKMKKVKY